jgi:tellurium resistance protein TerD
MGTSSFSTTCRVPRVSLTHTGDNRTGAGEGDDETLKVDLSAAPAEAVEVSFIVTMHDALARRQHFGMVQNAYLKVYNDETGEVLAAYDLDEEFAGQTAVQIGSLFKAGDEWQFQAVGAGYQRDLLDFVRGYGLEA